MLDRRSFQLPGRAVALVLAGGRGSRLYELTDRRAKPAVYFGGKFRIIDFAMSNCVNSGIRRIGVVTQYKSHSLLRHLQRGWGFLRGEVNEFVDLLPAQQRVDEESWYRGTADAVYQNIDIIETYSPSPDYVVILAGDHVYKMNYAAMLVDHAESGAECTVACIEVPRAEASGFGVMAVDSNNRITDFIEKPADPPPMEGKPDRSLCSMGIYVFNAKYLYSELLRDISDPTSSHDFGKDIIPRAVKNGCAMAHSFGRSCVHAPEERPGKEDYWRDAGTVDAYWEANVDLTATDPALNLYDKNWPIWTYQAQLPPAKFVHNQIDRHGIAIESTVSGGCIISGEMNRSLLFSSCRVHSYAKVNWSVLLPDVDIGRGARLSRCIVDHAVRIPAGMVIGEDPHEDARRFRRTDNGVTLVTQQMLDRLT
ncbi:MAG: glucose-1-phosphate adenylyltransferase [Propionivibrio sp.]|jgi:glucose-1-phosphate adenylyltransferase|nr:glucose-1-phosphate adenylyltransferase [Propionivibrio sp.]MBP8162286.1 glucose-1-phosphate adenylyltransferase [Propionivibrio sp.]